MVGTFSLVNNLDAKVIENDLSVFTQQLSAQSPSQILTQGALNQKEVGRALPFQHLPICCLYVVRSRSDYV